MSIVSMMRTYKVLENQHIVDSWGAETDEEIEVGTANVTINYSSAANVQSDNRYSEVTHSGLTFNKNLKEGQILASDNERFVICLPPNNVTRYSQLYLKEVVK